MGVEARQKGAPPPPNLSLGGLVADVLGLGSKEGEPSRTLPFTSDIVFGGEGGDRTHDAGIPAKVDGEQLI